MTRPLALVLSCVLFVGCGADSSTPNARSLPRESVSPKNPIDFSSNVLMLPTNATIRSDARLPLTADSLAGAKGPESWPWEWVAITPGQQLTLGFTRDEGQGILDRVHVQCYAQQRLSVGFGITVAIDVMNQQLEFYELELRGPPKISIGNAYLVREDVLHAELSFSVGGEQVKVKTDFVRVVDHGGHAGNSYADDKRDIWWRDSNDKVAFDTAKNNKVIRGEWTLVGDEGSLTFQFSDHHHVCNMRFRSRDGHVFYNTLAVAANPKTGCLEVITDNITCLTDFSLPPQVPWGSPLCLTTDGQMRVQGSVHFGGNVNKIGEKFILHTYRIYLDVLMDRNEP